MKKCIVLFLLAVMCLPLCACGGSVPAESNIALATEPTTEPTTEPVSDITVYAMVPEGWENVGCWAYKANGPDAFANWPGETMSYAGDGWYEVSVPGWIDFIIINGNNGSLQTADLSVEESEYLWIHVVNPDYAVVHYDMPAEEQLKEERDKPGKEYHESVCSVLNRGGYRIGGTKFVAYSEAKDRYCTDYVPSELLAETPENIYFVIHLEVEDEIVGTYFGYGDSIPAVKPGIKISIKELATGKVVVESAAFMGGDPPEQIATGESGRGTEPDSAAIQEWIRATAADIMASAPVELPEIPLNEEALTPGEKAQLHAKEIAEEHDLSYKGLIRYLSEHSAEPCTAEEAKMAADNCGADWKQNALDEAKVRLGLDTYSYAELIDFLVVNREFTREEAVYAANNCGTDWGDLNLSVVQEIFEDQPDAIDGYYSHAGLVNCLVKTKGLSREEATIAADICGADWMNQALLEAQRLADEVYEIGYSEAGMREHLGASIDDYGRGFTQEEVAYAMENVKADWAKEAVKRAAFYLEYVSPDYTKEEMVDALVSLCGFSLEDATYGAEMNGLK